MKHVLSIILIGLYLGPALGFAQQPGSQGLPDVQAQLEQTKQRLNPTDEQVAEIRPILKASLEETRAVLDKHGIDLSIPEEQRDRPSFREMRKMGKDLKVVRESTTAKLAEILSEEQLDTYKEIQEERRKQMREQIRAGR